jgi:hypothetical protein
MAWTPEQWLPLAVGFLGGSVVATLITAYFKARSEFKQQSSMKQALLAEVDHAEEGARGYLILTSPRAPIWRPSKLLYPHAATSLMELGAVNAPTMAALLTYYDHIESFSRALDAVSEAQGDDQRFREEAGRAVMKASLLVSIEHVRDRLADPSIEAGLRQLLEDRVRTYGDEMPVDVVRHRLRMILGTPFVGT